MFILRRHWFVTLYVVAIFITSVFLPHWRSWYKKANRDYRNVKCIYVDVMKRANIATPVPVWPRGTPRSYNNLYALKSITTSGLQIFGKSYVMTLVTSRIWQNPKFSRQKYDFKIILMSYDK